MARAGTKGPASLVSMVTGTNMLFGMIPLFVVPLLRAWPGSTLVLVFVRFLLAGGVLGVLVLVQIVIGAIRRRRDPARPGFFTTTARDVVAYLTSRNKDAFNLPRMAYLLLLAFFGVTLNVITYFIALDQLNIVLVIVVLPGGTILLVFLANTASGKERASLFKIIYIGLMVLALVIAVVATGGDASLAASPGGIVALVLNVVSLFVLFTFAGKDTIAPAERTLQRDPRGNYKLVRTLAKVAVYMLAGAGFVPLVAMAGLLAGGTLLHDVSVTFWTLLPASGIIVFSPFMMVLVLACTVLPNVLLFTAGLFWDVENSLSFDSWTSILNLVDPITGIVATVFAGLDDVDPTLMGITVAILAAAILLRFVHESEARINAIIFLNVVHGHGKGVFKFLASQPEIRKFFAITGTADIMIKATFGSMKEYHAFIARVGTREEIKVKFDLNAFLRRDVS